MEESSITEPYALVRKVEKRSTTANTVVLWVVRFELTRASFLNPACRLALAMPVAQGLPFLHTRRHCTTQPYAKVRKVTARSVATIIRLGFAGESDLPHWQPLMENRNTPGRSAKPVIPGCSLKPGTPDDSLNIARRQRRIISFRDADPKPPLGCGRTPQSIRPTRVVPSGGQTSSPQVYRQFDPRTSGTVRLQGVVLPRLRTTSS